MSTSRGRKSQQGFIRGVSTIALLAVLWLAAGWGMEGSKSASKQEPPQTRTFSGLPFGGMKTQEAPGLKIIGHPHYDATVQLIATIGGVEAQVGFWKVSVNQKLTVQVEPGRYVARVAMYLPGKGNSLQSSWAPIEVFGDGGRPTLIDLVKQRWAQVPFRQD